MQRPPASVPSSQSPEESEFAHTVSRCVDCLSVEVVVESPATE